MPATTILSDKNIVCSVGWSLSEVSACLEARRMLVHNWRRPRLKVDLYY